MKSRADRLENSRAAPGVFSKPIGSSARLGAISKTTPNRNHKKTYDAIGKSGNSRLIENRESAQSAQMTVIELIGNPEGKGRARFTYRQPKGRPAFAMAYTPAKTRAYERNLGAAALIAMTGHKPLQGPLKVTVLAYMPVPRSWSRPRRDAALAGLTRPTGRPDWDNLAKVCDALNGIVWIDDSQVVDGYVSKRYSESPKLRVEVTAVAPPLLGRDSDDHIADPTQSARNADADRMETAAQPRRNRLA